MLAGFSCNFYFMVLMYGNLNLGAEFLVFLSGISIRVLVEGAWNFSMNRIENVGELRTSSRKDKSMGNIGSVLIKVS